MPRRTHPIILSPPGPVIEAAQAHALSSILFAQIGNGNCRFVIDLGQAEVADEQFLDVILRAAAKAQQLGGWFRVAAAAPAIRRTLLEAPGGDAIEFHDSVIAAYRGEPPAEGE